MVFFSIPVALTTVFNGIAAGTIIVMMTLTCLDVVCRFFRYPIPGTYEIVGLLGAVVISFSLASTSLEKGHIAVEFLVQKLPRRIRNLIDALNDLIACVLFTLIGWQSFVYAAGLKESGEVSLTLQLPIYPFVYGVAVGCCLLCLVLLTDFLKILLRGIKQ